MIFTPNLLDSQKDMEEFLTMVSPSLWMQIVKHMSEKVFSTNKYLFKGNKDI